MQVELLATDAEGKEGDLISAAESAAVDATPPAALPPAHARPGEARKTCWERLRLEARAAGMSKRDAYQYATREVDRVWVPPSPPPVEPDPPPVEVEPAPEPEVQVEPPAPDPPAVAPGDGLAGLGDLPDSWPVLPANASLQAEIAWTQANRLRVRQGEGVDLGRALSPAPSYAALSWLETSILYPAKFADVAVKATQERQDDAEQVRRERLALLEVKDMLGEAMATPLVAAS